MGHCSVSERRSAHTWTKQRFPLIDRGYEPRCCISRSKSRCALTTFEAVQSRRAMKKSFFLQLKEISERIAELVCEDHITSPLVLTIPFQQDVLNQINVRSEKLKEYDDRATKALEERNLRHKEWKAWKPDAVRSTSRFPFKAKPKVPLSPIPTDSKLNTTYDHAGQNQEISSKMNDGF